MVLRHRAVGHRERLGLRIGEVPVDWVDDPDSWVRIVSTAKDDLRGVWRMLVRRPRALRRECAPTRWRPISSCASPGWGWSPRSATSSCSSPGALCSARFGANAIAMAIAMLFNTAVHRELSRTADGQARRGRLLAWPAACFLVSLGLTTLGLVVAQWIAPGALAVRADRPDRGQPGRRRVPVRRAAGLDLPPERRAGPGSLEVAQ